MHSTSNCIFTAGTILQVIVKSYPIHPLMKQQSKVYVVCFMYMYIVEVLSWQTTTADQLVTTSMHY